MSRQFVRELKDGDSVDEVYLLADKQLRANRNANLYLLSDLRDRTGSMSGLMWNVTEESVAHVNPGDYVHVRGKVQQYQGSLQMILAELRAVSPATLDPRDFELQPPHDIQQLRSRLKQLLGDIGNRPLRLLVEHFLADEELMEAFAAAPAGVKAHHAYTGGLIEHVVNMLEVATRIHDLYPEIDFDLLRVGIFLHDMGKVRELSFDRGFSYTDEGQLVGHLVIGVELLDQKIAELRAVTGESFPEETALRLKHMILSHHGSYEFGSPRLPMTPEAIALHHLDNLDAKVHEFSRAIEADPTPQTHWTPYHTRLGRKLFKGSPNGDAT